MFAISLVSISYRSLEMRTVLHTANFLGKSFKQFITL